MGREDWQERQADAARARAGAGGTRSVAAPGRLSPRLPVSALPGAAPLPAAPGRRRRRKSGSTHLPLPICLKLVKSSMLSSSELLDARGC